MSEPWDEIFNMEDVEFQLQKHGDIDISPIVEFFLIYSLIMFSYLYFIQFWTPIPSPCTLRLGIIQMHILQSKGTMREVEHLQHMPRLERNANGLYHKHMCIMHSCFYMQDWLHEGKHIMYAPINFKLQQGYTHRTWII